MARWQPGHLVGVAAFDQAVPRAFFTAQFVGAGGRTFILWLYWPMKGCEGLQD